MSHQHSNRKIAFLFPGSGSQYVGMGKDLYDNISFIKKYLNNINNILGYSLTEYMFYGPEKYLHPTLKNFKYTKGIIFLNTFISLSLAISNLLKKHNIIPDCVAGRSLGEYTVLKYLNIINLKELFNLTEYTKDLFKEEIINRRTKLLIFFGINKKETFKLTDLLNESFLFEPVCIYKKLKISFFACDENKIPEIKEIIHKKYPEIKIKVSKEAGAYHSSIYKNISKTLLEKIKRFKILKEKVNIPVYLNCNAKKTDNSKKIIEGAINSLSRRVYWEEILGNMYKDGVRIFVEIGSENMLTEFILNKKDITVLRTNNLKNYEYTIKYLKNI